MTRRSRRRLRWLVPASAVAATALVAGLPRALPVGADPVPVLPTLTPGQLLSKVKDANVTTLSGDVKLSTNLGLPDLSSFGGGGGSSFLDLLSGTHVAHLWVDGPEHARLALDSPGAENDWIRNGTDLWAWDSATQSVKHATLPAESTTGDHTKAGDPSTGTGSKRGSGLPAIGATDPIAAADAIIAAIDPTTSVTVTTPGYVAGRPVYELVVAPKSADSTIGDGVISVDAATGIPLGVRIDVKGSTTPAVSLAFTSISFDKPAASTFEFTPPAGATVTEASSPAQLLPLGGFVRGERGVHNRAIPPKTATPGDGSDPASASVSVDDTGNPVKPAGGISNASTKVVGNDWASVAIISNLSIGGQFQALFSNSPSVTVGSTTGHLVSTRLINVLILADGRIVIGAVTPAALEAAAANA